MAREDVRYEGGKMKHADRVTGYVHVLLADDDEGPVATHRMFPATEEGREEAMRHASQTAPSRKPCVVAVYGSAPTVQDLESLREQIQHDLTCVLDGHDRQTISNACQVVVDRVNAVIEGMKRVP